MNLDLLTKEMYLKQVLPLLVLKVYYQLLRLLTQLKLQLMKLLNVNTLAKKKLLFLTSPVTV